MVIDQNICKCQRVYGKFLESSPLRNLECFWRVFQKLSGFIRRVECREALRKCMESLKVCDLPKSSIGTGTNIATGSLVNIVRLVDMDDCSEDKVKVPGGCFRLKSQFSSQSSTDWWHKMDCAGVAANMMEYGPSRKSWEDKTSFL